MSQADLQTIYVMVVMLTTISGHTMMGYLIPVLAHTFQFRLSRKRMDSALRTSHPDMDSGERPRASLTGFYEGDSTLYTFHHAQRVDTAGPRLVWFCHRALADAALAVTVFLRKQWTENERLNYPIVQLPLALTSNPERFFQFAVDVARLRTRG